MRRCWVTLVWALVWAAGCARGWVPDLVVRGELAQGVATSTRAESVRDRREWRWRAGVSARWRAMPVRAPRPEERWWSEGGEARPTTTTRAPTPCRSEQLCAWERRAKRRALEALREGGVT